jgi:hypothetical protein
MDTEIEKFRTAAALILNRALSCVRNTTAIFRPENVYDCSLDICLPDMNPNEKIMWYAAGDNGEKVYCVGMSLAEFYEQYRRQNTIILRQPELPIWILRRKFKVVDE